MDLKELLGEELYNQVVEKAGDNKIAVVSDGQWIPKQKFDDINTSLKDYKDQLKERDAQLEELKKVDAEGLQQTIADLQETNKTTISDYEEKLQQKTFDYALKDALTNAKVRNTKAAKALLDLESIKLDGDKFLGLDDQLNAIKESDPYLFDQETKPNTPQIVVGGNPQGGTSGANPFSKESWNLTEQGKLYKENPDLYNALKAQAGK
ncbi:scaffolding protein [Paenibacillus sp. 7884-2]|nr:scaffolding protein [Paenibacillus sp. 7884-2]